MEKKFLFLLVSVFMMFNSAFAQNQLVATLKHGDTTTFFYGSSALQLAHDKAESGDIITLSEGTFGGVTLSKAVSIKGNGAINDNDNGIRATIVSEVILAGIVSGLEIEGVSIKHIYDSNDTNSNLTLTKCKIDNLDIRNSGEFAHWTMINCIVLLLHTHKTALLDLSNCAIVSFNPYTRDAVCNFYNCVVRIDGGSPAAGEPTYIQSNTYKNCVLWCYHGSNRLNDTNTILNCVGINVDFYNIQDKETDIYVSGDNYSDIFKSFSGEYSDSETFELTDEAKSTYLGDDGTQVGIYGGELPFNTILPYPQFTKANVAKKAVDGKLSVNIELNGN